MSFRVTLVRSLSGTVLGKEIKAYCLRVGKRRLVARFARLVESELGLIQTPARLALVGAMVERARGLHPRFLAKYSFLVRYDERVFAETVSQAIAEGDTGLKTLRGKIVERFIPDMKEMTALLRKMDDLAKTKGWKPPTLLSGAHTPDGNEIADWLVVAQHEDGRIWIMAIIESKSISNTVDLARGEDRVVGQHLWDLIRLKSEGLVLNAEDGKAVKYLPKQIEVHPVPLGAPPPSHGLTTELIGVTPSKFTKGQLRSLSAQGADVKQWLWPVKENDLENMLRELRKALDLPSASE